MFTSLLVGLDGSPQAQVALAQAIIIGRQFHSRIVVAHISPAPGHTSEMALGAPWMEWKSGHAPVTRREHEDASRLMLEDAVGAVRRAGLEAETAWRTGDIAESLRELAGEVGVVCVGRLGARSAQGTDALGPDVRALIRRSPRPVLVCGSTPTPMDRVLVAYGGGPASEGALAFASRFAGITGAHLDVLHVAGNTEEGGRTGARASRALSMTPLDYDIHVIEGNLETAVAASVERLMSNALFAGAHREESGWLVPSHTETILRATDIPVLVHMQPAGPGARTAPAHRSPASR
jgi:nucleotide-binding universal stress UspA family protein